MSKKDELKFAVKKSLIVGTATATLGAMGCTPISNPVPERTDAESDVADAGADTSPESDTVSSQDGSETDDASSDSGPTEDAGSDTGAGASDGGTDGSDDVSSGSGGG